MLGIARSAFTVSSKRVQGRVLRNKPNAVPRKLSQISKRSYASVSEGNLPKPGSREAYKYMRTLTPIGTQPVDYSVPERIVTLDDIETNREAVTVNGRLRHLVNIGGTYEEAMKLCDEAVAAGVELDVMSWVYLSTLIKPALADQWAIVKAEVDAEVEKLFKNYVPDSNAIVQSLKDVKQASDAPYLYEIITLIRQRKAKLDIDAITAVRAAYDRAGLAAQGASAVDQLHKDFLIDTPTFDSYIRISKPSL